MSDEAEILNKLNSYNLIEIFNLHWGKHQGLRLQGLLSTSPQFLLFSVKSTLKHNVF